MIFCHFDLIHIQNSSLANLGGNRIVANGEEVLLMEELPHERTITVSDDQLRHISYIEGNEPIIPVRNAPQVSKKITMAIDHSQQPNNQLHNVLRQQQKKPARYYYYYYYY